MNMRNYSWLGPSGEAQNRSIFIGRISMRHDPLLLLELGFTGPVHPVRRFVTDTRCIRSLLAQRHSLEWVQ